MSRYRLTTPVMIRTKLSAREVVLPVGTEVEVPSRISGPGQWVVVESHTGRLIREFAAAAELAAWLRQYAEELQT